MDLTPNDPRLLALDRAIAARDRITPASDHRAARGAIISCANEFHEMLTKDHDQPLHHDEHTMTKVYHALVQSGIAEGTATEAVGRMQNAGILFRERPPL